ncbi:MAG: indolepyruvate ferredoxin oxidoreductase family protein [Geminicoccaceae bacterium]
MIGHDVSLDDKYTRLSGRVLINGIEALVRLPLDQARQDRRSGLRTGGFISGYRGSPLGGYDQRLEAVKALLEEHRVQFQPGVNEDLAATAVWGSQQVNLHDRAKVDGVFGLWYGKAPGVDRTGDVFRHANMTGTWRYGGVLAIAGDDPLAKSSSLPSQSEFALVDAEIPVLVPADIQDVLDLGLHGLALSRHSGLWTGLIALADLMDGSATVDVDPMRMSIIRPADDGAPRHITLDGLQVPHRLQAEERLRRRCLPAVLDYSRANRLNRVLMDSRRPRIGLAASGKNWSAVMSALDLLGIEPDDADRLGLRLMKIVMPWPLEPEAMLDFASGLETVLVVEAKRPLIETQLKDQLYHLDAAIRPTILGKTDARGAPLLPSIGDLDAVTIASVLLTLLSESDETAAMRSELDRIKRLDGEGRALASTSLRAPHFCSGCPHSRSTHVPAGSRAMAGIGCHIMTQWMGGEATGRGVGEGSSQMGGEGVAWLGQAAFTETPHVFANLGDGTYYHSGLLAIRAAIAAKARITYKILYNDAVAMTGGQSVDGPLSVEQIAAQVRAEGVERIVVLSERSERFMPGSLPHDVDLFDRDELAVVQEELRGVAGVSVLIFDQTCAAEKRRRRKRGLYPPAPKQVLINDRVCEGCGDCSRQSNCLSVEPFETAFGTKRRINPSSCNQDLSCTAGFCPSFVTIEGGIRQKPAAPIDRIMEAASTLALPPASQENAASNILLAGIGGTGVTTTSAILAMAAHLDDLAVVSTDMTGLAQKGGAVVSYVRLGPKARAIHGARITPGAVDLLLGCDLIVAAGADCLKLCSRERTSAVADAKITPTGSFALHQTGLPERGDLEGRVGQVTRGLAVIDAGDAAETLFGDRIFANMMLVGAAFQQGDLPLSLEAIERAIIMNAVAVQANRAAFHAGRVLFAEPSRLPRCDGRADGLIEEGLNPLIDRLSAELVHYQDMALADRYRAMVAKVRLAETALGTGAERLTEAVAGNLFKLMAYKDEYEVARLHADPAFRAKVRAEFGPNAKLSVQLAPPLLSRLDPVTGRLRKMTFGPWIFPIFSVLARFKGLRGTKLDLFGWTAERRMERRLVEDYERLIERLLPSLSPDNHDTAVALASLPMEMNGFGPVKAARIEAAKAKEQELLAMFERPPAMVAPVDAAWSIAAE